MSLLGSIREEVRLSRFQQSIPFLFSNSRILYRGCSVRVGKELHFFSPSVDGTSVTELPTTFCENSDLSGTRQIWKVIVKDESTAYERLLWETTCMIILDGGVNRGMRLGESNIGEPKFAGETWEVYVRNQTFFFVFSFFSLYVHDFTLLIGLD